MQKKWVLQRKGMAAVAAVFVLSSFQATAQDAMNAPLETVQRAENQQQQMQQGNENLNNEFDEASQSVQQGEFKKAIKTYEMMLARDPNLHRVRLDYALALFRVGRFQESKQNFNAVLEQNIPDIVRKNVEQVLAQVEKASKEHYFSGMIATGFNFDTNANTAPSSNHVTVFEQNFELSDADKVQRDGQYFGMVTINHRWQPIASPDDKDEKADADKKEKQKPPAFAWNSTLTGYKSHQQDLSALNITMMQVRTGPEYKLADGKVTVGAAAGYARIQLDGQNFLRSYSGDVSLAYAWDEKHQINVVYTEEFRDFINSDTTTTFEDRQGQAMQGRLGFNYLVTEKDIISLGLLARNENTKKAFYDNLSISPSASYTHQWEDGTFAQVATSYKYAHFSGTDPFISDTLRVDQEYVAGITIGRTFLENMNWTLGYQYTNVDSTIQNYEHDNHRVSSMVAVKF